MVQNEKLLKEKILKFKFKEKILTAQVKGADCEDVIGNVSSRPCYLSIGQEQIRDPKKQLEMVSVPEEHLSGHAFHMYHLESPDKTVSFEFQHIVCGRLIYAEGSIDAAIFWNKKIQAKADKRIYDMIDVLREGNMR